jgi:DNA polymerase III gamma/tau subunit
LESDDDDDGIPPAPLNIVEPETAARSAPQAAPQAQSTPSAPPSSSSEDIDQFWSEVKENLQKRHLPTFSIVSVHAFPVTLDNADLVLGVRKEYFQKQLETKIEHLKAACAAASGRTMNVRIKVIADNAPAPVNAVKASPARPKETRSAPADSEEGESRAPSASTSISTMNSQAAAAGTAAATAPRPQSPTSTSPARPSHSSEIEHRIGGNLINEAYKLFEGPGSRLIG